MFKRRTYLDTLSCYTNTTLKMFQEPAGLPFITTPFSEVLTTCFLAGPWNLSKGDVGVTESSWDLPPPGVGVAHAFAFVRTFPVVILELFLHDKQFQMAIQVSRGEYRFPTMAAFHKRHFELFWTTLQGQVRPAELTPEYQRSMFSNKVVVSESFTEETIIKLCESDEPKLLPPGDITFYEEYYQRNLSHLYP